MKHIQWFPGHMTKAMRMMEEQVKLVDGVLFILDARAPLATRNRNLESLFAGRPVLYILNKADLADEGKTAAFSARMEGAGEMNVCCTATGASAARQIAARIPKLLHEKLARDAAKGVSRPPRLISRRLRGRLDSSLRYCRAVISGASVRQPGRRQSVSPPYCP